MLPQCPARQASSELNRRLGRRVREGAPQVADRWTERHLKIKPIWDGVQTQGFADPAAG